MDEQSCSRLHGAHAVLQQKEVIQSVRPRRGPISITVGGNPRTTDHWKTDEKNDPIVKAYEIISQLTPEILANQGQGKMQGFIFDHNKKETSIELGGYILHIKHIFALNYSPKAQDTTWQMTGGLVICTGEGKYIIAGSGIVVTFEPSKKDGSLAGILSVDQGTYENGMWKQGRRLNGDEDHQGRHARIFENSFEILKVELYRYK